MKRTTLNQLANMMDGELGWFDYFVEKVYNGNHSDVKETLGELSKRETLKVIDACVDELDGGEYSCHSHCRDSVRRLYNYSVASLDKRL